MILQRCTLPVLKNSARLRYAPSLLCAFPGIRRVATASDPNAVSALFVASHSIPTSHILANAASETNTTL